MASTDSVRVRLIDQPDGPPRTTATLVASLAARLAALYYVSGADAIGSLTAGFAALGREVARTAEGARMRESIEASRAGINGRTLWSSLKMGDWASTMVPSPILDQLRNDVALLLSEDLEATLQFMPIPSHQTGIEKAAAPEAASFVDCVLGLWAFSRELVEVVQRLASPPSATSALRQEKSPSGTQQGPILR